MKSQRTANSCLRLIFINSRKGERKGRDTGLQRCERRLQHSAGRMGSGGNNGSDVGRWNR
eukprot:scaffold15972_cov73-Cyclotella_meneghiniana.AAC.10